MALQNNDLFVIQSQTDNQLYKLKLQDLITEVEAGPGVNFRGAVDLNNPPGSSGVTLPAPNGDLYVVESDAASIDGGWNMQGGETSATKGDRIIFDGDNNDWILITSGSSTAGTVTNVTASLPLESDSDPVDPVISILTARTTAAAGAAGDSKGTAGAVARLADNDDVKHTDGTGSATAVVTADLLKATNDVVEGLATAAGGVQTLTVEDTDLNSALTVAPTSGNVKITVNTATESKFGVVQIANASDITAGTAGGSAVIDAAALKNLTDNLPDSGVQSITEDGTDIVVGALQISDTDGDVEIGVNKEVFAPFNFAALPDITA